MKAQNIAKIEQEKYPEKLEFSFQQEKPQVMTYHQNWTVRRDPLQEVRPNLRAFDLFIDEGRCFTSFPPSSPPQQSLQQLLYSRCPCDT